MATSPSPSPSPPPQDRPRPPSLPPPPKPHPSSASRRLPPPCWSHDETVALIDSYRDKWYSLRRGNLKAEHWQEVADAVAARCPLASPPKTSVQCRHKMEKLRKRYRTELNRSLSAAPNRSRASSSSWVHFNRMHSMEKGPAAAAAAGDSGSDSLDEDDEEDDDNNEDEDHEANEVYSRGAKHGFPNNRTVNSAMGNGIRSGFRIKFPGGPSTMAPPPHATGIRGARIHDNPNPNPKFGSRFVRDSKELKSLKRERDGDPVAEMVGAVKVLGDGFVRMEKMKMEMAREMEAMRMEMEMKRTEMILQSQQRIVEAFTKGFAEKKKRVPKRMPSPES